MAVGKCSTEGKLKRRIVMTDEAAQAEQDTEYLERLAFLEKLKGPRNPTPPYVPPPPTAEQLAAEQAERERIERVKSPSRLPPKPERDFMQEQRQRLERERLHEKLKGAMR
jgi:hypothetical protein